MLLIPNYGIGELVFGQSEQTVKKILGFPDLIDESWENENELVYQYYRHKMSLHFYLEEQGKLGYIKCANPNLSYYGNKLIHQNIVKVKNFLTDVTEKKWEEEHFEFHQTYFSVKHWITLIAKYNEVIELEIGIPYLNNEKHDWELAKLQQKTQKVY